MVLCLFGFLFESVLIVRLGRAFVLLGEMMRVDFGGDARVGVPETEGNLGQWDALIEEQAAVGVPQAVQAGPLG